MSDNIDVSSASQAARSPSRQPGDRNAPMETDASPAEPDEVPVEAPARRSRESRHSRRSRNSRSRAERTSRSHRTSTSSRHANMPISSCHICATVYDDIVRQVHQDLLNGQLRMVGIERTKDKVTPKTQSVEIQTDGLKHCASCQCQRLMNQRDIACETTPKNKCQCQGCIAELNAGWMRMGKAFATKSNSPLPPYCERRAHEPCVDDTLKDFHKYFVANDQYYLGNAFIDVLFNLHDQGSCGYNCEAMADIEWMKRRIPKPAATQTYIIKSVRVQTDPIEPPPPCILTHQSTQASLQQDVGIQKGVCLAGIMAAKASLNKRKATQADMPDLPDTYRPVAKVIALQKT